MQKSLSLLIAALFAAGHAFAADVPAADVQPLKAAVGALAGQLGAELKKELSTGTPESAIAVCKDAAPRIAGEISRQTGMKVTRVSLKTRNPMLGSPDAWEQAALQALDARFAKGEKPETLEVAEVVTEPAGRSLRYLKAVPVQPLCLSCHGTPSDITPSLKEKLAAAYPHDRATGYSVGQLRGAVSVKKALD